jgi:hypothetical protein
MRAGWVRHPVIWISTTFVFPAYSCLQCVLKMCPFSYFIIFMHLKILVAQAFAVGMLMAWYPDMFGDMFGENPVDTLP